MKKLLLVFIILYSNSHAQELPSYMLQHISSETYKICRDLEVQIRPNISKDSSLIVYVNKKNDIPRGALNSTFQRGYSYDVVGGITDTFRYYLKPKIAINTLVYLIVTKKIDTTTIMYYKAISTIIHEYTHYLQVFNLPDYAYFSPPNIDSLNMRKYISQREEFEAHAVQSYYLLKMINKQELKKIMGLKIGNNEKMKKLINAYYALIYPWRKYKIFTDE